MKNLYRFTYDYGRMGTLEGLFVATEYDLEKIKGKSIYFGEVLGKHSDIGIEDFDPSCCMKIEVDEKSLETISAILGRTWSGWNPIDTYEEHAESDENDEESDEFE